MVVIGKVVFLLCSTIGRTLVWKMGNILQACILCLLSSCSCSAH